MNKPWFINPGSTLIHINSLVRSGQQQHEVLGRRTASRNRISHDSSAAESAAAVKDARARPREDGHVKKIAGKTGENLLK